MAVPPYADPLDRAPDPRDWWHRHRPLVMETGGVGPREGRANSRHEPGKHKPDPSFQGFRVLTVEGAIVAMHYVRLEELRAANLSLPWELFAGATVRIRNLGNPERSVVSPGPAPRGPLPPIADGLPYIVQRLEPLGGNVFRIRDAAVPGRMLHIQDGPLASGPIDPGWHSARWTFAPVLGAARRFQVRNLWKPDQCLNIEAGPLTCGPIEPGWLSAQWTVEAAPLGTTGTVIAPSL